MKRPHILAVATAAMIASVSFANTARAQHCHLTYMGGPVLQHVKVVTVFWSSHTNTYQSQLEDFFKKVTNSAYFDWLSEYNTTSPVQKLGRGSWVKSYQLSNPTNTSTNLQDSDIATELSKLVDNGTIPWDNDTLIVTYFPVNYSITDPSGAGSCQIFCGYHSSTTSGAGKTVRYAIIPDITTGPCSNGCGQSADPFGNYTSVTSHELIEGVTDPDVGNATAWYAQSGGCGEIGDICNGQAGMAGGYTVQLEWSNKNGQCIDHDPNVMPTTDFGISINPTTVTVQAGSSGSTNVMTTVVGMAEMVHLSVSGLPTGVTGAPAPASVTSGGSSTLTLNVAGSVMPGDYPFTVTGSDGTNSHDAAGTVTVTAPPPDLAMPMPPDMAMPSGGGGNGGGGNTGGGGNGGGGNVGGNGGGNGGGGQNGCGCTVGGVSTTGAGFSLGVALLLGVALISRRRRA